MADIDPVQRARNLATEAVAAGDPTGWFERLYAEAADGDAIVPWDRGASHPLLVEWTQRHLPVGRGGATGNPADRALDRRALVVGCGLGDDAELISSLGFDTVAFDISSSAIEAAQRRFPDSNVRYLPADLLRPRTSWRHAFDLVIEILTVQSLPLPLHQQAIRNVADFVALDGTLLVISGARDEGKALDSPPWPLTRSEIDTFGIGGLRPLEIEELPDPANPEVHRWRATFRRTSP